MKAIVPFATIALSCCGAPILPQSKPLPVSKPVTVSASSPVAPKLPATQSVEVISIPPGARIEVNNDYVGQAPCIIQVEVDPRGGFMDRTVIRALPIITGQQTQTKFFSGWGRVNNPYLHSDRIPARILFDMGLVTIPRNQIDLNVH